ncbi:MAG: saccharopine dehydrogenase-like protein [Marinobacter sp. T13-3]|nr:MAG: saccharopine dehydrogenase-like protein [Marinobacter sp. T13-3]
MSRHADRPYDLVVFGATSFVGKILTRYLMETCRGDSSVSWAIAGRSKQKLEALKAELGDESLPVIEADVSHDDSLEALCEQTRVVISTVGPYALYGEPLIQACVESGTDYCDLAGEVQWIRRMISRYEVEAKKSGARIVHCCGFDSIPSDMGVWFLQNQAQKVFGEPCQHVRMRVKAAKGGLSGGTFASMINLAKEAAADPALRKEMANPFSLCPEGHRSEARQPSLKSAEFDRDFQAWLAPFVMGAINTRVVHRSNALQEARYGQEFTYDEAIMTGRGFKGRLMAYGMAAGLGLFFTAAAFKPTRWVVEKLVPAPGEGPSPEEQENGFYDIRFIGRTSDNKAVITKVTGDRDPGYGSTSKMLGQSGLCLAFDLPDDAEGGFWTPASLLGDKLFKRLTEHAGLRFEKLETR